MGSSMWVERQPSMGVLRFGNQRRSRETYMSRRRPSIRSRLVDCLLDAFTAQGLHAAIADDDLCPAKGHWRSSPYADVYRWEGYIHIDDRPGAQHLVCWDTMTDCVAAKRVTVEWNSSILAWEVWADMADRPAPRV